MPTDAITISNNNVILMGGTDQDGIQWTPKEGVEHAGTDYGSIQAVTIEENQVTVVTDQGTLTFAGEPVLDEAKTDFTPCRREQGGRP